MLSCLIFIQLSAATFAYPPRKYWYRRVFKERWGEDEWAHSLGNPCRGEPTPPDWADVPVLNVTGRLDEVGALSRRVARSLALFRVFNYRTTTYDRSVQRVQELPDCPTGGMIDSLQPLNKTVMGTWTSFDEDVLLYYYETFYRIAAHFMVMTR